MPNKTSAKKRSGKLTTIVFGVLAAVMFCDFIG